MSKSSLPDRYNPNEVEQKTYQWWESNKYFAAQDSSTRPPYCIILPPPNVTGFLHMGHALDHTIQDVLIRWKRMSGFNVLWLPGTDHAGIATQSVVEKELAKNNGMTRQQLGREKFVEKVWDWKHQYGNRIVNQMKRLGDSCDWDRLTFTLDDGVSKAVRRVFVDLYKKQRIYKGKRLINWSPKLESALSDLEVEFKETKGNLWHMKYPLIDAEGYLVVATTRPETMLGDTAVCVHPEDERYKEFIGKQVRLPIVGRSVPVIADEYVDKEFGSGVVKITPAHDFNDYEIGKRHDLQMINILNKNGTLNKNVPEKFRGLSVSEARKQIVAELEELGALVDVVEHTHSVGRCQRTDCVIEPMLSEQWFVNAKELAVPAKRVVESGTIVFEPDSWTKTYLHWMNNIQDWCISRQLWWGHRIPAWYCEECQHISVAEVDPNGCENCGSKKIRQDEDVLDTWFSSGLWPFSTMGWPDDTETQKTFYPTNVLVTGHDIIFFWVARMIMLGLEFKQDVPFRTVYIHGLIRDSQGRKMSKSLGNSVDPVELVEKFGADALRFTLMSQIASGRDIKFSMQRLESNRNFMNKIWNATRFALNVLEDFKVESNEAVSQKPAESDLSQMDRWIISKIGKCEKEVDDALHKMNFSEAANCIYSFIWHEFCDWYLEFIKPVVYSKQNLSERKACQLVLAQVLNRWVRMLHPFAPFISEEIYQKLPIKTGACIVADYPTVKLDKEWLKLGKIEAAFEIDVVREVITAIRNIRGENRIKPSEKIVAKLHPKNDKTQKILQSNKSAIITMAGLGECIIEGQTSLSKSAVTPILMEDIDVDVIVPLEGLVDFEEEIKRISKNIEKLEKEETALNKRLSNSSFVSNAPPEVVEEGRKNLQQIQTQVESLKKSLARLK